MAVHPDELEGLSRSEVLRASPRMFESEFFERLSRVHPAVPPAIFGPAIIVLLVEGVVHGAGWLTPAWLLGGYVFWTLTEYWLHRLVFHFEPERGLGARLHWIIHGVHHDHPNDPMRLVMPPSVSVPCRPCLCSPSTRCSAAPDFCPSQRAFWPDTCSTTCCTITCTITRRARGWAASCASCTCATTSRITSAATA